jgi:hypothetical protein
MLKIKLFLFFLVVYGSLFPFSFEAPTNLSVSLDALFTFNPFQSGIADSFANLLLFVPLGLLLKPKAMSLKYIIITGSALFFFAFAIQVIQVWSVTRVPFGADAVWNTVGAILGLMLSPFLNFKIKNAEETSFTVKDSQQISFIVFIAFIVVDLFPLVPSLDIGYAVENIKKLTDTARLAPLKIIKYFAFYTLMIFFAKKSERFARQHLIILLALPLFFVSQVFIIANTNDINTVLGLMTSLVLCSLLFHLNKYSVVFVLSIVLILTNGMGSFEYTSVLNSFNLIPFAPALGSNTLVNIFAFLEKGLYYFTFTYLAVKTGRNTFFVLTTLPSTIFLLELFQIHIANSTPDVTELLLCILISYSTLRWLSLSPNFSFIQREIHDFHVVAKKSLSSSAFVSLILLIFATIGLQYWFMNLSGIPYNIAEMYVDSGNVQSYFFTAIATVSFGFGIAFITYHNSYVSKKAPTIQFNKQIFRVICVVAITFLILRVGITRESIADINGSSNLTWQLTGDKILGDFGVSIVTFFGRDNFYNTSQLIEPVIRFALLLAPLAIFLSLGLRLTNICKARGLHVELPMYLKFILWLVFWLFLSKLVTFDYSSTDNLNELIERDGAFGLGGGAYLYMLLALISVVVVYFVNSCIHKSIFQTFTSLVLFLVSIPISWALLSNGLEDNVFKYGHTFSGVDFLLGGSRSDLLSTEQLQFRWMMLYTVIVLGLTVTIKLGISFSKALSVARANLQSEQNFSQSEFMVANEMKKAESNNKRLLFKALTVLSVTGVIIGIGAFFFNNLGSSLQQRSAKLRHIPWASSDASLILDHHTHTSYSDGNFTVDELSEKAKLSGCDVLAVTDHTDSERTFNEDRLNDIKLARIFYAPLMVINGLELNAPSYGKQEHINLLVAPSVEEEFFSRFNQAMKSPSSKLKTDSEFFGYINTLVAKNSDSFVASYNHPSRKIKSDKKIYNNYLAWNMENLMNSFSGAPGHQKSTNIGSYDEVNFTSQRWDPVTSKVGGVLDLLLDKGHDVYGSLAPSDYHNDKLDFSPCSFSKTHLIVPSNNYDGVFRALKNGTYWGSQGGFLKQFHFSIETSPSKRALWPGEIGEVDKGELVLVEFNFVRSESYVGLPLEVEILTNCSTGKPEALDPIFIASNVSRGAALLPINSKGLDAQSCYVRSRVKTLVGNERLFAYSNHIRLYVN